MEIPRELSPVGIGASASSQGSLAVSQQLNLVVELIIKNRKVFDNIPPDIMLGELLDMADDAISLEPPPLYDKEGPCIPKKEYISLSSKTTGDKPVGKDAQPTSLTLVQGKGLLAMIHSVDYWRQGSYLAETLNGVENLSSDNVFLSWDPDEEELRVHLRGTGDVLLTLYGEEIYQDTKDCLDDTYFNRNKCTESKTQYHPLHGMVEIEQTLARLQGKDKEFLTLFSRKPKFLKLETLFESFYGSRDVRPFSHRMENEGIFLTYKGMDVVSYNIANISWPHLKRAKKRWKDYPPDRASQKELERYKKKRLAASTSLGSCYYAPLLEHGIHGGLGRLVDMDVG